LTDWPLTIDLDEALELTTYREVPDTNRATFEPSVGPPKVRRRSTLNGATVSFMLWLSKAQVATLDVFFRDTLKDGVLPFEMQHPRTGTTETFRFEGEPQYEPISQDLWKAKIDMRKIA
jgi:hypothetical protein